MRGFSYTRPKARSRVALIGGLVLALGLLVPGALGATTPPPPGGHANEDFAADDFYFSHHAHAQHGPSTGHLEGEVDDVDLVGQVKLTNQINDISDVSALQTSDGSWFAYVGDWGGRCQSGGVHVVDITDPENPVKVG